MNRVIKFRGKRVDNGEWEYGDYFQSFCENKGYINSINCLEMNKLDFVEIDCETIGQFTGLVDNNGKYICEGDIVNITGSDVWSVEYDENEARFIVYNQTNSDRKFEYITDYDESIVNVCEGYMFFPEVIGNIHDNPELLK